MRGVVYNCGQCPYLPKREFHAFHPDPNPPTDMPYRALMDFRFRRSGNHLYMPVCPSCNACQPIRIDIGLFHPRADQKRCLKNNRDLTVTFVPRGQDDERRDLLMRYEQTIHKKDAEHIKIDYLCEDGGIRGGELHARDKQGRLLAVSVVDTFDDALSSVYCYYDPDFPRRSLGTFMILSEIAHCRARQDTWLYLGFYVRDCQKMSYKARFRPHEILVGREWIRHGH
jgi:leucyl-tRNA---protein transferase